jgi:hypothetical protein
MRNGICYKIKQQPMNFLFPLPLSITNPYPIFFLFHALIIQFVVLYPFSITDPYPVPLSQLKPIHPQIGTAGTEYLTLLFSFRVSQQEGLPRKLIYFN